MTFTLFLKHIATGDLFEIPFDSINYVEELNNGGQMTLTLDFMTIKEQIADVYGTTVKDMFTAVLSEMWVQIDNGTKIWYGLVTDYQRSRDATTKRTLTIACVDYFSIFQKRRTAAIKTYTAVDPATIPWDLINTSQLMTSGGFGIIAGATASTGLTVSIDYKRDDIKQAIANLSNAKVANSFDFDIDYTKKLNIYYPTKGSDRPNVAFDDNNILADGVIIPLLLSMTNSVFARGHGINNDVPEHNSQATSLEIAEYTLLEDIITDSTTGDSNVLTAEGDKYITLHKLPLYQVSIKHSDDVDLTTYGVGDTVRVSILDEGITNATYRVKKRTVDIDFSGNIIVSLDLLLV